MECYIKSNLSSVSIQIDEDVSSAYSRHNKSLLQPRLFGVKDDIFCLFEGMLDNLGSLRQEYGLAKSANEVMLVIEAYKALHDRAPYPLSHVVGHLSGNFAFVVFDKSTSTLFVASGITADGFVAFSNNAEMLKGACGKSLATFPQADEEIWGATFKEKRVTEFQVEEAAVLAATE
ncbi:hypothetical protein DITRI_Ditri13aG0089100 [Diplodiscus trichospermus]